MGGALIIHSNILCYKLLLETTKLDLQSANTLIEDGTINDELLFDIA